MSPLDREGVNTFPATDPLNVCSWLMLSKKSVLRLGGPFPGLIDRVAMGGVRLDPICSSRERHMS
jgi:hypothetical protein